MMGTLNMDSLVKQIRLSSTNDILLEQAFSEVFDWYLTLSKRDASDCDYKHLWELCCDESFSVSAAASNAVVRLLNRSALSVGTTLNVLLSIAPTIMHLGPLVRIIGEINVTHILNCGDVTYSSPFKIDYPQDPLITVFSMRNESWPWILQGVKYLSAHENKRVQDNSLRATSPLILHVICSGENKTHAVGFRHQLWTHLLWTLQKGVNNSRELVLRSLSLMQETNNLQFFNHCLQTLAELVVERGSAGGFCDLAPIVALLLASNVATLLAEGKDVNHTLLLVDSLTHSLDFPIEPLLVLLAESLLEKPTTGVEPILRLCLKWKDRVGHALIWRVLQSTALQIAGFQTESSTSAVTALLKEILAFDCAKLGNCPVSYPHEEYLNPQCRSAIIATRLLTLPSGDAALRLQRLNANSSVNVSYPALFLLAGSIFLETTELEIIRQALKILTGGLAREKKRSLYILALLLRKLSTKISASVKTEILYNLPLLASDKLCIPKLLQIINTLDSVPNLRPLRIRLLTDLWLVEDRTYSYLEKALQTKERDFELSVAKAFAVYTICATRPEKYGSEWLAAISHQLSGALGGSDDNGSTLAVISLRTLVCLCEAEVVDLRMCKLLGLTPKLRVDSAEFEVFVKDVLQLLFGICLDKTESEDVNLEAYRALSGFSRSDFTLDVIPDVCKACLKVNAVEKAAAADVLLPQFDNLVPGECWGQLLEVDPHERGVELLLGALVQQEVKDLPNWVYRKTASEHIRKIEPPNYNYLKEDSVLRGLIRYLSHQSSPDKKSRMVFRVLDQNFEKVLPPLDWFTLWPIAQTCDCEEEFTRIICRLCPTSFSACRILESFMQNAELKDPLKFVLLENLAHLSTGLGTKAAQDLLKDISRNLQEEPQFFRSLSHSLNFLTLPEEIALQISYLLRDSRSTNGEPAFSDCVLKLPNPMRETLLKEGSTPFLANYLSSAVSSSSDHVLESLIGCAESVAKDERLLAKFTLVLVQQRSRASIASWLQKFVAQLRFILAKNKNNAEVLLALSDIFACTLNALGEITSFGEGDATLLPDSWNNLDLAVSRILREPKWKTAHQEITDWLLMTADLGIERSSQRGKITRSLTVLKSESKLQNLRQWSLVASVIKSTS